MKRFSKEELKKFLARWVKQVSPASESEPHRVSAPLKERTLVEGIESVWHYHLSDDGRHALCGARVMISSAPESSWGYRSGHLHERYCKKCEELRRRSGDRSSSG